MIFIIITLLLTGYIIYDKVLKPTEPAPAVENPEVEDEQDITEDEDYFNELLYIFLPINSAGSFMRNIETFKDDDITNYIFWYYENYANFFFLCRKWKCIKSPRINANNS